MCFQNNCILGSALGQSLSGPFQIVQGEGMCPELFYSLDFQLSGGLQEILSLGLLTETMKRYLLLVLHLILGFTPAGSFHFYCSKTSSRDWGNKQNGRHSLTEPQNFARRTWCGPGVWQTYWMMRSHRHEQSQGAKIICLDQQRRLRQIEKTTCYFTPVYARVCMYVCTCVCICMYASLRMLGKHV